MGESINLAVLLCDENLPELEVGKQTLPMLWSNFFAGTPAKVDCFRVFANEWPDSSFKHFLITGSRYSVLDNTEWMLQLGEFIRDGQYNKLIGICFGHQMIAHHLGGEVVAGEWHVGVRAVKSNQHTRLARYNHQDHVVAMPPNAVQSYTSDQCEIAGFTLSPKILSYQFHPEFTERYHKILHDAKRDNFTEDQFLELKQHLDDPTDHDYYRAQILDFLMHD